MISMDKGIAIVLSASLLMMASVSSACSSSRSNADIARNNYPNSWPERNVATYLGDEIPNMRDDLIERKNNGEGIVERHWNAWRDGENWQVDPDNDAKEAADPYEP